LFKIDHVGIAVNSLEEAIPLYSALLDQNASDVEEVSAEKVRVVFFGQGTGRIELLEATDADSPIGRFIDRSGPGMHHICFAVADIEGAIRRADAVGAELIPPGLRVGAGGLRVAFLHPRGSHGVLIELSELDGDSA
jgi:methylmalonyl-CoA/ethylmalonyl-CoA epimerase